MMNRLKENLIESKDLIAVGIFTALYYISVVLSNVVLFIIPGYSYVYIPIVVAFLAGTVYMLTVTKIPRFGAISIMGLIMGLNFFLTGRYPLSLLFSLIIAVIADLIAWSGRYKRKNGLLASYIVFSYNTIGPVLPMFLFPNRYVDYLVEQGRDAAYIENAFANISTITFWVLIIGILVAASLGGLFGQRMLDKHFKRAGIL